MSTADWIWGTCRHSVGMSIIIMLWKRFVKVNCFKVWLKLAIIVLCIQRSGCVEIVIWPLHSHRVLRVVRCTGVPPRHLTVTCMASTVMSRCKHFLLIILFFIYLLTCRNIYIIIRCWQLHYSEAHQTRWLSDWVIDWVHNFSPWASSTMEVTKEMKFGTKVA